MGNLDSKYQFEHGSIYCQTDKAYYVAGEPITGNIYLNLTMSYPASSLEIEVTGKEKLKWTTQESRTVKDDDNDKTEFVDVDHKNDRKVIKFKCPVYYFPGGMAPPGQYTFPFSFALPSTIPATMFWNNLDKAKAKIKYKLKASLESGMGFSVKTMKHKQTLIIRQPEYATGLNPMQSDTRNVYMCCCFGNKGQAKITAQFEKDNYTPEEICRAMCDVDNSQCGQPIRNIGISLEQHVDLKASDGQTYSDRRVLSAKDYDGLAANASTGGLNRYLELGLADIRQQPRGFDDGKPLDADDLFLAERLQPTATGTAVKLRYTLTVRCNYGVCCAEEPHCTIPLTITPPPLPSYGQIQAPSGWAPTVYSNFNFQLPGPGDVMNAAAQAVAPVTAGMNVNVNMGHAEEVKMNVPTVGLTIDTDMINNDMPIPQPAPAPAPAPAPGYAEHAQVDMQVPGMTGGMNMQVTGTTAYHETTTIDGVTTSSTTRVEQR